MHLDIISSPSEPFCDLYHPFSDRKNQGPGIAGFATLEGLTAGKG